MSHIVIIGSGHSGLTLAREIRLKDADCKITILSKETICAYYKPNLSKALSSGKTADQLLMKASDTISSELKVNCVSQVEVLDVNPEKQECMYQSYDALNQDAYPYDLNWLVDNQRCVIQGVGAFDNSKKYPFWMFMSKDGAIEIALKALENFIYLPYDNLSPNGFVFGAYCKSRQQSVP